MCDRNKITSLNVDYIAQEIKSCGEGAILESKSLFIGRLDKQKYSYV